VLLCAALLTAIGGIVIGLPTLRLRGDYLAIVTLGFGEIIPQFVRNADSIKGFDLTHGTFGISPIDSPGFGEQLNRSLGLPVNYQSSFDRERLFFWTALGLLLLAVFVSFRLRDSRLGRAWIAIREDEVAAASMGVPLVKTKLLAYATGAAFAGISGAFLGSYLTSVNANNFQFGFSIFILAMIILGGLGSIWGVALGAVLLSFINTYFIPNVFNSIPGKVGLDFDLTELNFGIFGFLILLVMVLRPQGLVPERRRKLELTEGVGAGDAIKVDM
jgi:branched-chain amino acid transport system permease protein